MSIVNSIRVSKGIEQAILSGQFKPRERLIEMDLIERFGISRTVIREAFKRLEAKGLIRVTPYRGAVVADLTVEEIEEIYFVRIHLERVAARLVLEHITQTEIKRLKKLSKDVEKHLREKSHQMIEKDSEFHRAIFKNCHNRYLYDMIDFLRTKAHIVRFNAWSLSDRIEQSIIEHREMIKAIEDQNLSQFDKLIVKHHTYSKESYMAQLKGGDLRDSPVRGKPPERTGKRFVGPSRGSHLLRTKKAVRQGESA
jgi:DNA-binding GntR family transcriptional regulator